MKILIILPLVLTGCATYHYSETLPNGVSLNFDVTKFGTDAKIDSFSFEEKKDGKKQFTMQGYTSDQTKAIGIAVDAAVKAAITSMKP